MRKNMVRDLREFRIVVRGCVIVRKVIVSWRLVCGGDVCRAYGTTCSLQVGPFGASVLLAS